MSRSPRRRSPARRPSPARGPSPRRRSPPARRPSVERRRDRSRSRSPKVRRHHCHLNTSQHFVPVPSQCALLPVVPHSCLFMPSCRAKAALRPRPASPQGQHPPPLPVLATAAAVGAPAAVGHPREHRPAAVQAGDVHPGEGNNAAPSDN